MKFKVGDKIRIKRKINCSGDCGGNKSSCEFRGRVGKIKDNDFEGRDKIWVYFEDARGVISGCSGFTKNDMEYEKINWEEELK